jgi:hypothetical protein
MTARAKPNAYPNPDSQQDRLLKGLLAGDKITPISAIVDYNCLIPAARCAELRRLGWPIRTTEVTHPNHEKFPRAKLTVYFIDDHFRLWYATQPNDVHPAEYKGQEGRGKFAGRTLDQIASDMDDDAERRETWHATHPHRPS